MHWRGVQQAAKMRSTREIKMSFLKVKTVRSIVNQMALIALIGGIGLVSASFGQVKQEAQGAPQPNAVSTSSSSEGLISNFEDGTPQVKFGVGWMLSTDSIAGGKSIGEMKVVDGGANGGAHALDISGLIDGGLPYAWAGVMFSPGSQPFMPMDLSARKSITFWAKGDGQTCRVLVFTVSGGRIPARQTFNAGSEWKKTTILFSAFNGTDGHDINAILFVGGPVAGRFDFQIDEISLE
jgi:hypothetical protein